MEVPGSRGQTVEIRPQTCSNKVIGPPIGCKTLQRPKVVESPGNAAAMLGEFISS